MDRCGGDAGLVSGGGGGWGRVCYQGSGQLRRTLAMGHYNAYCLHGHTLAGGAAEPKRRENHPSNHWSKDITEHLAASRSSRKRNNAGHK